MRVAEVFAGLQAAGYQFTGSNPKKTLGVRMYKLPGVQSMGDGLFGVAPRDGGAPPAGASS